MTVEVQQKAAWSIDEQPLDYQVRYWRLRAEQAEAQLKQERKRKEPETLRETEKALRGARETIRAINDDRQVWKRISHETYLRIDELESEGAAVVLKRERDHWHASWRNCTRRLGNAIEHLGLDHTGVEPNKDE